MNIPAPDLILALRECLTELKQIEDVTRVLPEVSPTSQAAARIRRRLEGLAHTAETLDAIGAAK